MPVILLQTCIVWVACAAGDVFSPVILKIINRFACRTVELLALSFSYLHWSTEYDLAFAQLCFQFHFPDFHGWVPLLQFVSIVWEQDYFVWEPDTVHLISIYFKFLDWYQIECHQMVFRYESGIRSWFFFFFLLMEQGDYLLYWFYLIDLSYELYAM